MTTAAQPSRSSSPSSMAASDWHGDIARFLALADHRWREGGELYGDDAFLDMPPNDLITNLEEELADVVNYAKMLGVHLARMRRKLAQLERQGL